VIVREELERRVAVSESELQVGEPSAEPSTDDALGAPADAAEDGVTGQDGIDDAAYDSAASDESAEEASADDASAGDDSAGDDGVTDDSADEAGDESAGDTGAEADAGDSAEAAASAEDEDVDPVVEFKAELRRLPATGTSCTLTRL